jgi:hypothetical protein
MKVVGANALTTSTLRDEHLRDLRLFLEPTTAARINRSRRLLFERLGLVARTGVDQNVRLRKAGAKLPRMWMATDAGRTVLSGR